MNKEWTGPHGTVDWPPASVLAEPEWSPFGTFQSLLSDPGPEISEGTNLANDDLRRFRFKVLYKSVWTAHTVLQQPEAMDHSAWLRLKWDMSRCCVINSIQLRGILWKAKVNTGSSIWDTSLRCQICAFGCNLLGRKYCKAGVSNLCDLIPDDLKWSWCNN